LNFKESLYKVANKWILLFRREKAGKLTVRDRKFSEIFFRDIIFTDRRERFKEARPEGEKIVETSRSVSVLSRMFSIKKSMSHTLIIKYWSLLSRTQAFYKKIIDQ
jgi:hypothetical protein